MLSLFHPFLYYSYLSLFCSLFPPILHSLSFFPPSSHLWPICLYQDPSFSSSSPPLLISTRSKSSTCSAIKGYIDLARDRLSEQRRIKMTPSAQFGDTTYTKLFVGGLAWETQKETMKKYFEQFGDILEAVVITDKATGRSKGYGFVCPFFHYYFFSTN